MARGTRPPSRRAHAAARQPPARGQVGAWAARHVGDGQDSAGGRGRSAGDDRHLRLRLRPVTPALWPDHALRAAPPPHVRAMAPAGRRRRHQRVQLPRGRLVLERRHRGRLRRQRPVEARQQDAADRDRLYQARGGSRRGQRLRPGNLQPGDRQGEHGRREAAARQAYSAGVSHRLVPDGLPRRRGRRQAAGADDPRARRQQRDHRDAVGEHGPGGAGDPVRRGRHRRPALHVHAADHRPRVDQGRAGRPAGQGVRVGADRRPAEGGHADGAAGHARRGQRHAERHRAAEAGGRQGPLRRREAVRPELPRRTLRQAVHRRGAERVQDRAGGDVRADPVHHRVR